MTTVPPLPTTLNAFVTTSSSTTPTVTRAWSASWPQVSSATFAAASSADAKACVAPSLSAVSRLNASGSTAITFLAPAAAAACTALMPMPPMP